MKTLIAAAVVAGAIAGVSLTGSHTALADSVTFSFDPGGVAFAYSDGYWDRDHHWHRWRNTREARAYREQYADRYHEWRHDRDHDKGWHEEHEEHEEHGGR